MYILLNKKMDSVKYRLTGYAGDIHVIPVYIHKIVTDIMIYAINKKVRRKVIGSNKRRPFSMTNYISNSAHYTHVYTLCRNVIHTLRISTADIKYA